MTALDRAHVAAKPGLAASGDVIVPLVLFAGFALLPLASGGQAYLLGLFMRIMIFAIAAIGLDLRNQYVIGYRPAAPARSGGYHKVQVRLMAGRDLRVTWKPGYYDPE